MSINLHIRKAEIRDLDTIVDFNIKMALETENRVLQKAIITNGVKKMLENEHLGFYLIAEVSNQIVGSLMITTEWSDWRNSLFWWIQSVYVIKEFRRKGVYSSLYKYIKQLSAQKDVCGYRLYVEKENKAAQKTYEKLGMKETHYLLYEEEV